MHERLVWSAIAHEYHVMIQEGLKYSYVTNGVARVLLCVPYNDPGILYYFFCDPNGKQSLQEPTTSIARALFDHARSQAPKEVLQQIDAHSDSTNSEYVSSEPNSEYQPSSPPLESPTAGRRSRETSGSDLNQATGRKRGFSQVTSSPSAQRVTRLQTGGILDYCCPNVKLHRRGQDFINYPINSEDLIPLLKAQLDENIDRCIPFGNCGAYGASFKLICAEYGYVFVGKGTTSVLWKEVSREAQVYHILQKAQASAVPVFLDQIDLAKVCFLHGAGEIRHMLIIGWGGNSTATMELTPELLKHIHKSTKEIKALGTVHEDLRPDNVLWNEELGRALIIDFHRSTLRRRSVPKQPRAKPQFL
ncbi:hypothetical protein N7495_003184 [Penicillium taxi]|uniref:uncharacterized protein n=1 Tax=Penicillium taxi TaxID=168475 RepID=UPI0025456FCC|nr:uncharacterized protein N7495_003184 [Penicillium taxi]KAJ5902656.1 hypothetical protein N7495_003184 [Penicillium taxi]